LALNIVCATQFVTANYCVLFATLRYESKSVNDVSAPCRLKFT